MSASSGGSGDHSRGLFDWLPPDGGGGGGGGLTSESNAAECEIGPRMALPTVGRRARLNLAGGDTLDMRNTPAASETNSPPSLLSPGANGNNIETNEPRQLFASGWSHSIIEQPVGVKSAREGEDQDQDGRPNGKQRNLALDLLPSDDKNHERRKRRVSVGESASKWRLRSTGLVGGLPAPDTSREDLARGSECKIKTAAAPKGAQRTYTPTRQLKLERSSSITSDYFSNSSPSHNSTPIAGKRHKFSGRAPILVARVGQQEQEQEQQQQQQPPKARTTIYENPTFASAPPATPTPDETDHQERAEEQNKQDNQDNDWPAIRMRMAQVEDVRACQRQQQIDRSIYMRRLGLGSVESAPNEEEEEDEHHYDQLSWRQEPPPPPTSVHSNCTRLSANDGGRRASSQASKQQARRPPESADCDLLAGGGTDLASFMNAFNGQSSSASSSSESRRSGTFKRSGLGGGGCRSSATSSSSSSAAGLLYGNSTIAAGQRQWSRNQTAAPASDQQPQQPQWLPAGAPLDGGLSRAFTLAASGGQQATKREHVQHLRAGGLQQPMTNGGKHDAGSSNHNNSSSSNNNNNNNTTDNIYDNSWLGSEATTTTALDQAAAMKQQRLAAAEHAAGFVYGRSEKTPSTNTQANISNTTLMTNGLYTDANHYLETIMPLVSHSYNTATYNHHPQKPGAAHLLNYQPVGSAHLSQDSFDVGLQLGFRGDLSKWAPGKAPPPPPPPHADPKISRARISSWRLRWLVLLGLSLALLLGVFLISLVASNNNSNSLGSARQQSASEQRQRAVPQGPSHDFWSRFQMAGTQLQPPISPNHFQTPPVMFNPHTNQHQQLPPAFADGSLVHLKQRPPLSTQQEQQQQQQQMMTTTNVISKQPNDQSGGQFANWPPSTSMTSTSTLATIRPASSNELAMNSTTPLVHWNKFEEENNHNHNNSGGSSSSSDNNNGRVMIDLCKLARHCNANGNCDPATGVCSCLMGFSGPTCLQVNCPNECSRRGECKLRQDWPLNNLDERGQFDSIGFPARSMPRMISSSLMSGTNACSESPIGELLEQTRASSREAHLMEHRNNNHQLATYDNRLRWACECQLGFTGADCSQQRELNCQDELDNEHDGLVDCEDDDCCSQPACRDNLICYRPPEPSRALYELQRTSGVASLADELAMAPNASSQGPSSAADIKSSQRFFAAWRFLIANNSLQSYAKLDAFDRQRVAVIRGRVLNERVQPSAIVSVRVSVNEYAAIGFTLTRQDGQFDLLVNGNEWLTLLFHRNAYQPIKRRVFVRAQTINVLEDDVTMRLLSVVSDLQTQSLDDTNIQHQLPFGVAFGFGLNQLIEEMKQRDGELRRANLFECLYEHVAQPYRPSYQLATSQLQPVIMLDTGDCAQQPMSENQNQRTIALARPDSVSYSRLRESGAVESSNQSSIPPRVKQRTLTLQLLNEHSLEQVGASAFKLKAVHLKLDIEGQTTRERLEPAEGLAYKFVWNRRNVYEQKIFGFGQMNIRVDYEVELNASRPVNIEELLSICLESTSLLKPGLLRLVDNNLKRELITFEGRVFMEAHQLDSQQQQQQQQPLATMGGHQSVNERDLVHFSPDSLAPQQMTNNSRHLQLAQLTKTNGRKRLAVTSTEKGPNSSIFVALIDSTDHHASRLIQLDSSGRKRLLDIPMFMLTGKFQQQATGSYVPSSLSAPATNQQHQPSTNQLDDIQLQYNNFDSALYLSSEFYGKIVRVGLSSLNVLNKTLSGTTATLSVDDEIDIEPLCGFGRQFLASSSGNGTKMFPCKSTRLLGPHSMALDEQNQLLYFIDGQSSLMALNLGTHLVMKMSNVPNIATNNKQMNVDMN